MIIYANSRGSEKTANAIKMSASTHSILVVANQDIADRTRKQSMDIGYPVEVISMSDYFKPRNMGKHDNDRIVIDDIDTVLRNLFGCEVVMATTMGCVANIEIKEEPEDEPKFKWLHKY